MYKLILSVCLILLSEISGAINVDMVSYAYFGPTPYIEITIRIDGKSVETKREGQTFMSGVDIVLIISSGDNKIAAFDKFRLNSVVKDSVSDFFGVRRFKLLPGDYTIKLEVSDVNNPSNRLELEQRKVIENPLQPCMISDIYLLAKIKKDSSDNPMVKNGLYMEPLPYNFSSPQHTQIDFYVETYLDPTVKKQEYFIQYSIMDGFISNVNSKPILSKYKKINGLGAEPAVLSLPADGLQSGDYHLFVSIIDKQKNQHCSRLIDFVKSNPEADIAFLENYNSTADHSFAQKIEADDMDYILKAHLPITDQNQVSTLGELLKGNKIKSQRQFIFQLWKRKAPTNPEEGYNKYMEVARAVDKKFYTNVGYGFQSDRGHLFLKYGKPTNVISIDTELDAPPYEIWYYNYMPLTRQTNVRFLFYNPSLVHNDFKLLHSTCLSERVNPAWETELYKSVPNERLGNTVDAKQVGENWNRNARRYFNEY